MSSIRNPFLPARASASLACSLAGACLATSVVHGQDADEWTRHFRLGLQVGMNLKADFSLSGQFGISGSQPGPAGVSGANHFYDDGYVRVDQTGNAGGYTSYWGYTSPSQYDASTGTLTMHSAESFRYRGGDVSSSDEPYLGADLAYGADLFHLGRGKVGWELGFGLLPVNISDSRPLPAIFSRTVHSFNTGGIALPAAPYNGGPSGVGPTIPDVATALPDQTLGGTVTGSRTLDVMLYQIRLGPSLYWPLHRRWAVEAGGGFAMGIVTGDYRFDETTVLSDGSRSTNAGKIGATELVYGGYVNATLLYHATRNGDVFLSAQFMPLGDASISGAGRAARLDLGSGVYLSAGVNWPF